MEQVYIHLAEGFEEIEAITIIDVLRRAGIAVQVVSVSGTRLVKGAHQIGIQSDLLFEEVDYKSGTMIVLPGGMPGTDHLNQHVGLKGEILKYYHEGKYIAAICAAPIILGDLGILHGVKAVCYPGYEGRLKGAVLKESPFVTDQTIITGRGAGVALHFSLEIVRILKGDQLALKLKNGMLVE